MFWVTRKTFVPTQINTSTRPMMTCEIQQVRFPHNHYIEIINTIIVIYEWSWCEFTATNIND